jgi:hypothetical protein
MKRKHSVSYMTKDQPDNIVEEHTESFRSIEDAAQFVSRLNKRKIIGTKAIIGKPTIS